MGEVIEIYGVAGMVITWEAKPPPAPRQAPRKDLRDLKYE